MPSAKLFLSIEKGFSNLLQSAWSRYLSLLTRRLITAIKQGNEREISALIDQVDLRNILRGSEKGRFQTLQMSALLFGASQIAGKAKSAQIGNANEPPPILDKTSRQFNQVLFGMNNALRIQLLDWLAAARERVVVQKLDKIPDKDKIIRDGIDKTGRRLIDIAASLHASRLSSYGYCAEALATGITHYKINEQLDIRICPVCRHMHGKIFPVWPAFASLEGLFDMEDPADMKHAAPWPRQDNDSLESLKKMAPEELIANGWMNPPFHPQCRGVLVAADATIPDLPPIPKAPPPIKPPVPIKSPPPIRPLAPSSSVGATTTTTTSGRSSRGQRERNRSVIAITDISVQQQLADALRRADYGRFIEIARGYLPGNEIDALVKIKSRLDAQILGDEQVRLERRFIELAYKLISPQ